MLELFELQLRVRWRIRSQVTGSPNTPVRMPPFEVNRIDRILLALQPMARNHRDDDLPKAIRPVEEGVSWEHWRG